LIGIEISIGNFHGNLCEIGNEPLIRVSGSAVGFRVAVKANFTVTAANKGGHSRAPSQNETRAGVGLRTLSQV
jgi:hypothetical protein